MLIGTIAVIVLMGIAVWRTYDETASGSDNLSKSGSAQRTVARLTALSAPASPSVVPSATTLKPSITATITVPPNAKLADANAAATAALDAAATRLNAPSAEIVSVSLMTMEDALRAEAILSGQDFGSLVSAYTPDELDDPVWRVELGGAEFQVPSMCDNDRGIPEPCGSGVRAIYTLRASDGVGGLEILGPAQQ